MEDFRYSLKQLIFYSLEFKSRISPIVKLKPVTTTTYINIKNVTIIIYIQQYCLCGMLSHTHIYTYKHTIIHTHTHVYIQGRHKLVVNFITEQFAKY